MEEDWQEQNLQTLKQPSQHQIFLDSLFAELEKKKLQSKPKYIDSNTVYQGFKTIPIQQLEPRKPCKECAIDGKQMWRKGQVNNIIFYQQSCHLSYQHENGFFKAFYDAYINHGDIKITPDDVWLTIMIYFSKYAVKHSERLRNAFVKHEGKMELVIMTFKKGDDNWKQFFEKLIASIRHNTIERVTQHFECDFSTTNEFYYLFSTAMIMNTYKEYFNYTNMECICGIQRIHMGGRERDWKSLIQKLKYLQQFDVDGDLKLYIKNLLPVLDQFLETYQGNAHIQFWNNIYHERAEPMQNPYLPSLYINGWIIRFFTTQSELDDKVSIEEIEVPIKHVEASTKKITQLHLIGGCKGVSVEKENVYRPHFSFAIVEKTKPNKHKAK